MGFDGIFTDEQVLGDFSIAHTAGDQLKYLQLPIRNAELHTLRFIQGKWRCRDRHLTYHSFSAGLVSFRPSQIPKDANSAAIKAP